MSNFVIQTKLYWMNGPLQGKYSRRVVPISANSVDAEETINGFLNAVGSTQQEQNNRAVVDSVAVFAPGGAFKVGVVNCVSGHKVWVSPKEGQTVDW